MKGPPVTVLMPVYNGEAYLEDAVKSILAQTFTDFELLVINDASTDSSEDIIRSFNDPRIRILSNAENVGIAPSLNRGIVESRGDFVAIMNHDDLSSRERLAKQADFLRKHPEVGVCGTEYRSFGSERRTYRLPRHHEEIKAALLWRCSFAHPSVMLRKSIFSDKANLYSTLYNSAEDYELWTRLSSRTQFANIPEVLLYYRCHSAQVTRQFHNLNYHMSNVVRFNQLRTLGFDMSDKDRLSVFTQVCHGASHCGYEFLRPMKDLMVELKRLNDKKGVYSKAEFNQQLQKQVRQITQNIHLIQIQYDINALIRYLRSDECVWRAVPIWNTVKFIAKCLIRYKKQAGSLENGGPWGAYEGT